MTSAKTNYLEAAIRQGFVSEDVRLWQALCRQCELEIGDSVAHMRTLLELANHTESNPLDMISSGRQLSGQKHVNDKFIAALVNSMADDIELSPAATKILDLTADEELSNSGSYEETSEPGSSGSRLNSAECYEIDGFVVEDGEDDDVDRDDKVATAKWVPPVATPARVSGLSKSSAGAGKRLLKRRLASITEEEEE